MKLPITGLMCIPPIDDNPTYHFKQLKLLANDNKINELSIGMSDDYEQAIQFNPTYTGLAQFCLEKDYENELNIFCNNDIKSFLQSLLSNMNQLI